MIISFKKLMTKSFEYKGRIIGVELEEKKINEKIIKFEKAIRSPGVRIIAYKGNQILLTREFRYELNDWDYRLAGGKVVDTLEEYLPIREDSSKLNETIEEAVRREAKEELGLEIKNMKLLKKSTCGATIEWDLYYYSTNDFIEHENNPDTGEQIEKVWVSSDEAQEMCKDGRISEERSAIALLNFINTGIL
jgi:ADP-ribose pyrophosphatase